MNNYYTKQLIIWNQKERWRCFYGFILTICNVQIVCVLIPYLKSREANRVHPKQHTRVQNQISGGNSSAPELCVMINVICFQNVDRRTAVYFNAVLTTILSTTTKVHARATFIKTIRHLLVSNFEFITVIILIDHGTLKSNGSCNHRYRKYVIFLFFYSVRIKRDRWCLRMFL